MRHKYFIWYKVKGVMSQFNRSFNDPLEAHEYAMTNNLKRYRIKQDGAANYLED